MYVYRISRFVLKHLQKPLFLRVADETTSHWDGPGLTREEGWIYSVLLLDG